MAKTCKFNPKIRCFWVTCDFIDFKGNVRICRHHPNPFGYCMPKRVSPVLRGVSL